MSLLQVKKFFINDVIYLKNPCSVSIYVELSHPPN